MGHNRAGERRRRRLKRAKRLALHLERKRLGFEDTMALMVMLSNLKPYQPPTFHYEPPPQPEFSPWRVITTDQAK